MKKRALITGINGQDGSYLAEHLLSLDYEVYGLIRRTATPNTGNIEHILDDIQLIYGDVTDQGSIFRALITSQPDEVYNLAAQSFVGESWRYPQATAKITGVGALNVLDAIRQYNKHIRFYQASTSEMFGNVNHPINEDTPFHPRSPYGVAKVFAHNSTVNYRESFDMYAVCGILFNHESPRRGEEFVTRKITKAAARIKAGKQEKLYLGNTGARRDFGFAGDYVKAMHLMLQQDKPQDYIIGTGIDYSVQDVVNVAFEYAGLDTNLVEIDEDLFRPAEINTLIADPSHAKKDLGWKPEMKFRELIAHMVHSEKI